MVGRRENIKVEMPLAASKDAEAAAILIPLPHIAPLIERAVETRTQSSPASDGGNVSVLEIPLRATKVVGYIRARITDVPHTVGRGDGGRAIARRGKQPVVVVSRWTALRRGAQIVVGCLVPFVLAGQKPDSSLRYV